VVVLCLTLLPIFTATLVNGQLIAADRQLAWTGVMAACCIVNPALNLILIGLFERAYHNGALGASYALLITDGLVGVAAVALLPRDLLGRMRTILPRVLRAALAAGIMGAGVWALREQFVLVPLGSGLVIFIAAALALRVFAPDDLVMVRRLAVRLGGKLGLRVATAEAPIATLSEVTEPSTSNYEAAAVAGEAR
jgi:Na+-driven multidrug efflux pump